MKPGLKIAVLLGSFVLIWGLIAIVFYRSSSPEEKAIEVAETALYATVDCPESVRILAVSKPDSVFGRHYINDDEKMAIAMSMMKINEKVMSQTDNLRELDFEDRDLTALVERQMSAMSAIRSFVPHSHVDNNPKSFNGWKVKIEYEAKTTGGTPYRSEYWFILDKDARCVVKSFEIPIITRSKYNSTLHTSTKPHTPYCN